MFPFPVGCWNAATIPDPPGPPTNVTAVADDVDSLLVTWDAPVTGGSPSGYRGRWRPAGGAWGSWVELGLVETWTPTGMQVGSSNEVEIRAFNAGGESAGATDTATTKNLNAPTGVSAVGGSDPANEADISWTDASDGEDTFEIHRRLDGGSYSGTPIATDSASPYTDTTVFDGTTYWYKLRARRTNARGTFYGPYSAEDSVTLHPAVPTGLTVQPIAEAGTGETMRPDWDASNANDYDVRWAPDDGTGTAPDTGSAVIIATGVVGTSYDHTDLTANTHYWYQVRANAGGETSDWSAWVRGTTYREAPTISAREDSSTCPYPVDIDLTFSHTNAAGDVRNQAFEWRRSADGGVNWTTWQSETAGTTSSVDPGLDEGTYDYEVRYAGDTQTASTQRTTLCPE